MKKLNLRSQISDWQSCRAVITALVVCTTVFILMCSISHGAQQTPAKPVADGTILTSADGRLIAGGDAWSFELIADTNSISGLVTTGTRFELLPCRTLELLIADVNDRYAPTYRLAARVTRFRGKGFLFPTYYLPLSKLKSATSSGIQSEGPRILPETAKNGQGDPELTIPKEVAEKLRNRRMVRGPQRKGGQSELKRALDRMLVDAIGRIEPVTSDLQPPTSPDRFVFVPDAFGWNIDKTRYELLPCGVLEQALQTQTASPEPIRFNVAGLVTEFKGKQYLLLQRTIRAYGHGNFVK
jgi:hypothetical protein